MAVSLYSEQVLHLWLETLCSCVDVVEKWYQPWSFMRSPGWEQIKCELRSVCRRLAAGSAGLLQPILLQGSHWPGKSRSLGKLWKVWELERSGTHARTAILQLFIWNYLGVSVPEETVTHSHLSCSSANLYQRPPSTTIHRKCQGKVRNFTWLLMWRARMSLLLQYFDIWRIKY